MSPVLEGRGLTRSFGNVRALSDCDFDVEAGEVVALIGDNGAGKSTLVKALSGNLALDAGQILFNGQPVTITSQQHASELGIEVVYQDLALAPHLDPAQKVLIDGKTADTSDVVALPGAAETLAALPAGRWAIVTSCPPKLAKARLHAAGLPTPPTMVTSDDITHGKPHPDPFRLGAAEMRQQRQDCLAVEDDPAGIISARPASCLVLGLHTTHAVRDADTVKDLSRVTVNREDGGIRVTW
jgi:beta-phosphoglucomutase-like phosphatase (HAD superfamily)